MLSVFCRRIHTVHSWQIACFLFPLERVRHHKDALPHTVIVAQLVRALVCGTRGRGFESRLSPPVFLFGVTVPTHSPANDLIEYEFQGVLLV